MGFGSVNRVILSIGFGTAQQQRSPIQPHAHGRAVTYYAGMSGGRIGRPSFWWCNVEDARLRAPRTGRIHSRRRRKGGCARLVTFFVPIWPERSR